MQTKELQIPERKVKLKTAKVLRAVVLTFLCVVLFVMFLVPCGYQDHIDYTNEEYNEVTKKYEMVSDGTGRSDNSMAVLAAEYNEDTFYPIFYMVVHILVLITIVTLVWLEAAGKIKSTWRAVMILGLVLAVMFVIFAVVSANGYEEETRKISYYYYYADLSEYATYSFGNWGAGFYVLIGFFVLLNVANVVWKILYLPSLKNETRSALENSEIDPLEVRGLRIRRAVAITLVCLIAFILFMIPAGYYVDVVHEEYAITNGEKVLTETSAYERDMSFALAFEDSSAPGALIPLSVIFYISTVAVIALAWWEAFSKRRRMWKASLIGGICISCCFLVNALVGCLTSEDTVRYTRDTYRSAFGHFGATFYLILVMFILLQIVNISWYLILKRSARGTGAVSSGLHTDAAAKIRRAKIFRGVRPAAMIVACALLVVMFVTPAVYEDTRGMWSFIDFLDGSSTLEDFSAVVMLLYISSVIVLFSLILAECRAKKKAVWKATVVASCVNTILLAFFTLLFKETYRSYTENGVVYTQGELRVGFYLLVAATVILHSMNIIKWLLERGAERDAVETRALSRSNGTGVKIVCAVLVTLICAGMVFFFFADGGYLADVTQTKNSSFEHSIDRFKQDGSLFDLVSGRQGAIPYLIIGGYFLSIAGVIITAWGNVLMKKRRVWLLTILFGALACAAFVYIAQTAPDGFQSVTTTHSYLTNQYNYAIPGYGSTTVTVTSTTTFGSFHYGFYASYLLLIFVNFINILMMCHGQQLRARQKAVNASVAAEDESQNAAGGSVIAETLQEGIANDDSMTSDFFGVTVPPVEEDYDIKA